MNTRRSISTSGARTVLFSICIVTTACGGTGIEGSTYADNGGIMKIEFKPEGKAYLYAGPTSTTCSYTQSGETITLLCEGDTFAFTLDEDGSAINGPPDGLVARMTKQN